MGEESGLAVYIMYHQIIIESDIVYSIMFYDVSYANDTYNYNYTGNITIGNMDVNRFVL